LGGACTKPDAPAPITPPPQGEALALTSSVMADLLAMALACDLTRTFSILFSGSVCGTRFTEAGVNAHHHNLTHDEPGDQPLVQAATVFTMQMFAIFLERLRSMPEGDGNVLDRSALIATSDCSEGRSHSANDYPILIAGRAGGALVHPGIHYRSARDESSTDALFSVLKAIDLPIDGFGEGPTFSSRTLPGLLV
jgi:hypothetical protein